MLDVYHHLAQLVESGGSAALCTVVGSKGSTPRKPGAKMVVHADGSIVGTIGGGALEAQVIEDALGVLKSGNAASFNHALVHDHGMCCGGTVELFIEPIVGKKRLYIFGAGHIGRALAGFAAQLEFAVTLLDERPETLNDLPASVQTINQHHNMALKELAFDDNTLVAVITHDHAYDREIVAHCVQQPHAYLGMIGSERKVEMARKTFLAGNQLTEAQLAGIDWPIGIDIRVETPAEIAIAILARLIDLRAGMRA